MRPDSLDMTTRGRRDGKRREEMRGDGLEAWWRVRGGADGGGVAVEGVEQRVEGAGTQVCVK
jgi:hypothetical protein